MACMPMRKITSMPFSLDDIAKHSDVVLFDANSIVDHKIADDLYCCRRELSLRGIDIETLIKDLSGSVNLIYENDNIFTIPDVVREVEEFHHIINDLVRYHRRNIHSRRFRKGRTASRNIGRTSRYKPIKEQELVDLDNLRRYSDKLFELTKLLKQVSLDVNNTNLQNQIKKRAEKRGIKRNLDSRYGRDMFRSREPLNLDSDEGLIVKSYELAMEGKGVAIVTNDSDIYGMFCSCFHDEKFMKLPRIGRIDLFSKFSDPHYSIKFDTVGLLE